ncbi:hypothetical protein PR048_016452 [Dryococelus australis]|uniref:Uncharacterized protein n=1 Tax=Dryococelus australis TaxID=614101 RepID=A0ABQ9HJR6_9NEOP|nr:hypothetical protein PR048_016452 [Dryococelus australis]
MTLFIKWQGCEEFCLPIEGESVEHRPGLIMTLFSKWWGCEEFFGPMEGIRDEHRPGLFMTLSTKWFGCEEFDGSNCGLPWRCTVAVVSMATCELKQLCRTSSSACFILRHTSKPLLWRLPCDTGKPSNCLTASMCKAHFLSLFRRQRSSLEEKLSSDVIMNIEWHHLACSHETFYSVTNTAGAAVAERVACQPPITANQAQSPAGTLLHFRMWKSCRTIALVGGFSRGSTFPPPLSPAKASIPALLHITHSLSYFRLFYSDKTTKRASYKDDSYSLTNCLVISTRKTLNWLSLSFEARPRLRASGPSPAVGRGPRCIHNGRPTTLAQTLSPSGPIIPLSPAATRLLCVLQSPACLLITAEPLSSTLLRSQALIRGCQHSSHFVDKEGGLTQTATYGHGTPGPAKVFDSVPRRQLISRLFVTDILPRLIRLLCSVMESCIFQMEVEGVLFIPCHIQAGVP